MTAILLLIVGLLLIFLEFFLPGGIMGTAGALIFITSIVIFILSGASGIAITAFITTAIIALVAVLKLSLAFFRKTSPDSGLYESQAQEGYQASEWDTSTIGETGVALSDLKPSGHISIHGKRYQALSERSYINKGSAVVVSGGRGAYLIVKLVTEDEHS